jgi:hypothetical protein
MPYGFKTKPNLSWKQPKTCLGDRTLALQASGFRFSS